MRARTILTVTVVALLATGPVHAAVASAGPAKTYNDPYLEGDLEQIRVPEALTILARTPKPVTVGDIDTGAALNDADLTSHLVRMTGSYTCTSTYSSQAGSGPDYSASAADGDVGCDFIGSGSPSVPSTVPDGDPADSSGHGTGTAEIIAGLANNAVEGAGTVPNARVLPVRACYDSTAKGGDPTCYGDVAANGMRYAIDMGATIVNASLVPVDTLPTTFTDVVHNSPGVLFDFAISASHLNSSPYKLCADKADYPNVICVGTANADDTPGTTDDTETTDVSAPGYAGVPSLSSARAEFTQLGAATAHVSGAAALLRGLAPDLSPATIRQILVSTSRTVGGYSTVNKAGGIIDVHAAVTSVQQMEGLVTPNPGQGAPADSPDPFAGQTASGGPTTAPPVTAPPAPAPVSAPVTTSVPTKPATHVSLVLGKLPRSVAAGGTVKVQFRLNGGKTTVTVKLAHGKTKLASSTRHHVGGLLTVSLRLPRGAKLGKATLSVQLTTGKPTLKTITVTRPPARHVVKAR